MDDHDDLRRRTSPARWALRTIGLLVALVIALYAACVVAMPFVSGSTTYREVIKAPVAETWTYASNSSRAREWSVFFDHITPVTGVGKPRDGTVGSVRICYRNPDERGERWSERTISFTRERSRHIRTFDLHGFTGGYLVSSGQFDVLQDYHDEGHGTSSLRFTTTVHRRDGMLGLLAYPVQKAIFSVGPYDDHTRWTFKVNLENIRAAVEAAHNGARYVEPHRWQRHLWYEKNPFAAPPGGLA